MWSTHLHVRMHALTGFQYYQRSKTAKLLRKKGQTRENTDWKPIDQQYEEMLKQKPLPVGTYTHTHARKHNKEQKQLQ